MEALPSTDSGILSLSGFAYQIRLFVLYLASLCRNSELGFETFDDIGTKKFSEKTIQSFCDKAVGSLLGQEMAAEAIQVKHTKVTVSTFKRILMNWLILYKRGYEISKYILVTNRECFPDDGYFPENLETFYSEIQQSSNAATALVSQVKVLYLDDFTGFSAALISIKERFCVRKVPDADKELHEKYEQIFHRESVSETTYQLRIKALLQCYTSLIISAANNRVPFSCNYKSFGIEIEKIIKSISDDEYMPEFWDFQNLKKVDFSDLQISTSRECNQLARCQLGRRDIERYLIYGYYYEDYKYRNLDNRRISQVDSVEITTFDNFSTEKISLQQDGKDTPFHRLDGTLKRSNSYAANEQIRYGSAIHLTKEQTPPDRKISWEDGDNAK